MSTRLGAQSLGSAALVTAAIGSFVAGTLGTVGLTFLAPMLVQVALDFGAAEYFCLMVLAFTTVSAVLGGSRLRGFISLFVGLGLRLIGIDTQTGQARFTLGLPALLDGVGVVIVVVGLFAVGETLHVASRFRRDGGQVMAIQGSLWMTRDEWRRSWKPWLRGTLLGFPIGALPAGGAEIPTFLSYLTEKRLTPQETRETTNLARRIDQNLKKIFLTQFGHELTLPEWKALPIATRRAIDKQARQQAYRMKGD